GGSRPERRDGRVPCECPSPHGRERPPSPAARCDVFFCEQETAYEIMEQLGWRLPTAVVAPMAGGSLVTKLRKGFGEFQDAGLVHGVLPRLYGAQPSGCAPIVRLVERGGTRIEPEVPDTICRSLPI